MLYHRNIVTLDDRRQTANFNFLIKLINNQIESPSLIPLILLKSLYVQPVNMFFVTTYYFQLIMV